MRYINLHFTYLLTYFLHWYWVYRQSHRCSSAGRSVLLGNKWVPQHARYFCPRVWISADHCQLCSVTEPVWSTRLQIFFTVLGLQ